MDDPSRAEETLWLRRWAGGDTDAGRAFAQAVFPRLWRFFANKVDETETEDLIQETLVACLRATDRILAARSFSAYLFTVARNTLYRHLGRRGPPLENLGTGGGVPGSMTSPSMAVARRAEHRLLLEALRSLPVDLQVALELREWEGFSSAEIAEVLDIPASTIRGRLQRARELVGQRVEALAGAGPIDSTASSLEQWAIEVRSAFDGPE